MPLVACPCEEMAPMKQVQRDGVEIDVCTKCRGVWLDRGELEKLLAVVRQAEAEEMAPPPPRGTAVPQTPPQAPPPHAAPGYQPPPQQPYPPQQPGYCGGERGEYGERGEGHYDPRYGYKKKKRFDIFDIFD
jgi:uncharacterized protein